MKTFTIKTQRTPKESLLNFVGPYRAIILELVVPNDEPGSDADQEGTAYHSGDDPATCLGHALFYLSTVEDLEKGVKLDTTNEV